MVTRVRCGCGHPTADDDDPHSADGAFASYMPLNASIGFMLGYPFAFVLLAWPLVVLIGGLLVIGPGD
jgi:hypothetical protein